MITLVIISDDFTGALDTGVQFTKHGAFVKIVTYRGLHDKALTQTDTDVLVIDAETRHLTAAKAYDVTAELVRRAIAADIPYLYIKTDSGLRGNIGSEIKAALDMSGERFVPFLPAYPAMGRITRKGMHFVNEVPIHKSVFGEDPYEPVKSPYVRDLFAGLQIRVQEFGTDRALNTVFDEKVIGIFDSETNEDLSRVAKHLKEQGQLRVMAGCAGFAGVLPELIGLPSNGTEFPLLDKQMLVICGSLNPTTMKQISYAQNNGFHRIVLKPEQLLADGYFQSSEGEQWIRACEAEFIKNQSIVVDTGIFDTSAMERYMRTNGIEKDRARLLIANEFGSFLLRLLNMDYVGSRTIMIIGGDTLLGFIEQVPWKEITPICELELGTVLSSIRLPDRCIYIASKSGGFGEADLLVRLEEKL